MLEWEALTLAEDSAPRRHEQYHPSIEEPPSGVPWIYLIASMLTERQADPKHIVQFAVHKPTLTTTHVEIC
jgi:hypothetical protein